MRKLFLVLSVFYLLPLLSFGQCNVKSSKLDSGENLYMNGWEKMYSNDDLEYGILVSFIHLYVVQSAENKDYAKFRMEVDVGSTGSQRKIAARAISISFSDGTIMSLNAETLEPKIVSNLNMQRSSFKLTQSRYSELCEKSINKIVLLDNRENTELECKPYKDMLKEQANCILTKMVQ